MEMLARLGDVLYWLACITAVGAFSVILAFAMLDPGTSPPPLAMTVLLGAACAIPVWVVGLACRYILSGPRRV